MINDRKILLVLTLLALLVALSTVSAVNDGTTSVNGEVALDDAANTFSTQTLEKTSSQQVADTKNIEKDNNIVKTKSNIKQAPKNVTITPEKYSQYIFEGNLIGANKNTNIFFKGDFTDKDKVYIDTSDLLLDGSEATFTNTYFVLDATNITIQNMNINDKNMANEPIINKADNNVIANNTIVLNNTHSKATAIYNAASNTVISGNTLTVEAVAGSVDWNNPSGGVADTQAILLLGGNNNTVEGNNINIKCTQAMGYNTMEAITNSNGATNTLIKANTIVISGANFNYAIDSLNNVENITITENTVTVDGERYCDGIQVGNNARNIVITANNITCTCINMTPITEEGALSYGIVATALGNEGVNNMTVTDNNIQLTGTANYAIELYWVSITEIHNNTLTVNGPFSMGIGYAYSPNGNATGNTIVISGDSTTPINSITEEFKPENVGIIIQNGTQYINLENNTITTSDVGGRDSTIVTGENTATIRNNKLISSKGYGDETIKNFKPGVIMENNVIETVTTTEDVTTVINKPTILTATVTTVDGYNITGGVVIFTDAEDNPIAEATVTNAIAATEVTFTEGLESTLKATYTPTSTGLIGSSSQANIKVKDSIDTTTTLEAIATNNDIITLTATVTSEVDVDTGRVHFKVDGKILRDTETGRILYVDVEDGVATTEYNLPKSWGNTTTIEAIYTGNGALGSSKSEAVNPTIITPETEEPEIIVSDATATEGQATITVTTKNIDSGKIVLKVNGKTVKATDGKLYAKVTGDSVTFTYTVPKTMKAGDYVIKAVYSSGTTKLEGEATLTV